MGQFNSPRQINRLKAYSHRVGFETFYISQINNQQSKTELNYVYEYGKSKNN